MTDPQDALHARVRQLAKHPKTIKCLIVGDVGLVEYRRGVTLVQARDGKILEMHLTDAQAGPMGEILYRIYGE